MSVICIILAMVSYIFIGLFTCGFLDIDPSASAQSGMFVGVVMFWPLVYIAAILIVIFATPIRFGKRVGDKYLDTIGDLISKSINGVD
jgi:hypothetical protein